MLNSNEEPILTANVIQSIGAFLVSGLLVWGIPITEDQKLWLLSGFAIFAPLIVAYITRRQSTPLAAPKDNDGTPLVRSDTGNPTRAAVKYQRAQDLAEVKRSLKK